MSLDGQRWPQEIWDDKTEPIPSEKAAKDTVNAPGIPGSIKEQPHLWTRWITATKRNYLRIISSEIIKALWWLLANNRYKSGKNLFMLMRGEKRTKTAQARGSQLQTLMWGKPGPQGSCWSQWVFLLSYLSYISGPAWKEALNERPPGQIERPSLSLPHKHWKSILTHKEKDLYFIQREFSKLMSHELQKQF